MPVQQWLLQIINEQLVAQGDRRKYLQRHRVLINAHTRRSPMLDEPVARVHNAGFETAFDSIVKSTPALQISLRAIHLAESACCPCTAPPAQ